MTVDFPKDEEFVEQADVNVQQTTLGVHVLYIKMILREIGQFNLPHHYFKNLSLKFQNYNIILPFTRWHLLSHSEGGFKARAAHSAVYMPQTDSLYVFGGFDLNLVLGDLVIYRFKTSQWEDEEGQPIGKWKTFSTKLWYQGV